MNASQLLKHFDRISEAPDAIQRLRSFILGLAVRGKLVEQDPNDETAPELLKRIQFERSRMAKESMLRKQDFSLPIETDEVPFEVPASWVLVRLGTALELINGRAFKPTEWSTSGLPIIRIQNLNNADAPFNLCDASIPEKFLVRTGDFLISWSGTPGTSFGAHIWDRGPALLNQHIFRAEIIGNAFLPSFLKLAVNSRLLELIDQAHGGVGLQHITRPKLENLPLTLPPQAEQHRIVTKVDELMALRDRLEEAHKERESRRDLLAAASLQCLNQLADAQAFREHARFHLRHLPRLTTRPEHIQQLRQTILSLAVRGKLVRQDPNDEPAPKLLKKIEYEKAQLISNGSLRYDRPLISIEEDATPFAIPANWCWARIGTCSLLIEYGTSVKSEHTENGIPVIKMGDIQGGRIILGGQKKVPYPIEDLPRLFLKRFDLLYNRTNSAELVGKTGIYLGDDDTHTFASYLIRIRFLNNLTNPIYANLAMNAPFFRETQILPELQQQCGQANVNGTKLRNMMIPFPPIAEQHRIVAKVDELMAVCDRLETQLTASQNEGLLLLEALLHEALAPAADLRRFE